jgi:hypothetical protein
MSDHIHNSKKITKVNNFKTDEAKGKSRYKLWVNYKPEYAKDFPFNPYVYYSYYNKSERGLQKLRQLAENRSHMYILAIIYDNKPTDPNNAEIDRWPNSKRS